MVDRAKTSKSKEDSFKLQRQFLRLWIVVILPSKQVSVSGLPVLNGISYAELSEKKHTICFIKFS